MPGRGMPGWSTCGGHCPLGRQRFVVYLHLALRRFRHRLPATLIRTHYRHSTGLSESMANPKPTPPRLVWNEQDGCASGFNTVDGCQGKAGEGGIPPVGLRALQGQVHGPLSARPPGFSHPSPSRTIHAHASCRPAPEPNIHNVDSTCTERIEFRCIPQVLLVVCTNPNPSPATIKAP